MFVCMCSLIFWCLQVCCNHDHFLHKSSDELIVCSSTSSTLQRFDLPVVGSELVGLVPLRCILDAADFYIKRDNLFIVEEKQKLRLVGSPTALYSSLWLCCQLCLIMEFQVFVCLAQSLRTHCHLFCGSPHAVKTVSFLSCYNRYTDITFQAIK